MSETAYPRNRFFACNNLSLNSNLTHPLPWPTQWTCTLETYYAAGWFTYLVIHNVLNAYIMRWINTI